MYKETTLHSFEVHQKLATLFPLFASMCTAIHRSMTRNCARVFVAVVWSRCWRFFRVIPSPEIPLDTARRNLGMCKLRQTSRCKRTLQPRAAVSSSPMRTLGATADAEITGQAYKLRAGARCDCRKRIVKGRYARRRHLESLDKIIC